MCGSCHYVGQIIQHDPERENIEIPCDPFEQNTERPRAYRGHVQCCHRHKKEHLTGVNHGLALLTV